MPTIAGFHETPLERAETCEQHGAYTAKCYYRETWVGCPDCMKLAEQARIESEKETARKEAAARKAAAWERALGTAGIPERFKGRTLDNYIPAGDKQIKIHEFCRSFADDFASVRKEGRSFLMLGLPGTGKTHLSIGVALEVMRQGHTAVFTTASRMFRGIKDTYSKKSEKTEADVILVYTQCDLLIIDEVGVQRGSDYEKDTLFDVINERYENLRPTIILSNLTLEEAKAYLGERVFDRLRENGGKAFVFDWESYRGRAAA